MTDNEYNELINSSDLEKLKEAVNEIHSARERSVMNGISSHMPEKHLWLIKYYERLLKRRNDIRIVILIVLVVLAFLIITKLAI